MTLPNSVTPFSLFTYIFSTALLWLLFTIRPWVRLIRLEFLHRLKVKRSEPLIPVFSSLKIAGRALLGTETVASASTLSKVPVFKNVAIEKSLADVKPAVYEEDESKCVTLIDSPLTDTSTSSDDGDRTLVDPTLLMKTDSNAEVVATSHLFFNPAIPIAGTFRDLVSATISEKAFRRATQLPFGLQRTLEFDKITEHITHLYSFHPNLSYRSMLRTLNVGTNSLAELPLPNGDDAGKNTYLAMLFIESVAPQLNSIAQALLDIVNGTYDVDRCLGIVQDHWKMLESRIGVCGEESMNRQYETLLRFYQIYHEHRAVGNKREKSAAESCKIVMRLRKFHYLKSLGSTNNYAVMRQYSCNIRSVARIYYAEALKSSSHWYELKPKLKTGLFHRGLSEIQAEKVMEYARGMAILVQQLQHLQKIDLKYYTAYAEKEYLTLLFYIDKNLLCIKLSEQITFDQIYRETCQLLRSIDSPDQSVLEMSDWL